MYRPLICLSLLITACSTARHSTVTSQQNTSVVVDGKLFTAFYQQRAAEYAGLCFQAYNMAKLYLDQLPRESFRPRAIVLDLDETVLDNSPYAVHQALLGKDYDAASWADWTARAAADSVPGAPDFLHHAQKLGFVCYYVTNRDAKDRAGTLENLKKLGLPFADEEHLITRGTESSKESRRQAIAQRYEIVMLVGDNLSDLKREFDHQPESTRLQEVKNISAQLGTKYIILPNPNYGDWESSFYKFQRLSLAQKDSMIKTDLKTF